MLENEKHIADILLGAIGSAETVTDKLSAIARYREFVEAVNMRKRVLVTGWSELTALTELEDGPKTNTQWWIAEIDQYGNPTLVDGAHGSRQDAEDSIPALKSLWTREGKMAIVKVEIDK